MTIVQHMKHIHVVNFSTKQVTSKSKLMSNQKIAHLLHTFKQIQSCHVYMQQNSFFVNINIFILLVFKKSKKSLKILQSY
jgi:hypothetical protein